MAARLLNPGCRGVVPFPQRVASLVLIKHGLPGEDKMNQCPSRRQETRTPTGEGLTFCERQAHSGDAAPEFNYTKSETVERTKMNPRLHYQICLVGAMAALFVAVANYFNVPHAQNFIIREVLTIAVASVLLLAARASKAKIKN